MLIKVIFLRSILPNEVMENGSMFSVVGAAPAEVVDALLPVLAAAPDVGVLLVPVSTDMVRGCRVEAIVDMSVCS